MGPIDDVFCTQGRPTNVSSAFDKYQRVVNADEVAIREARRRRDLFKDEIGVFIVSYETGDAGTRGSASAPAFLRNDLRSCGIVS